MKKSFKSILSIILAVLITVTSFPLFTLAANNSTTITSGDYTYKIIDEEYAEITYYKGSKSSISYPATIDGYKVISIKFGMKSYPQISEITIPEGVESISGRAQYNDSKAIKITLPSTLKYIGSNTFKDIEISSINIPESLEGIDTNAFYETVFPDDFVLELSDNFKYLSSTAFYNTNLVGVKMGKNAKLVEYCDYVPLVGATERVFKGGDTAFANPFQMHRHLTTIEVNEENPYLKTIDNVLYSRDMEYLITYPSFTEWMNIHSKEYDFATRLPTSDKYSFTVPNGVKKICDYAFNRAIIYDLTLSNSVEVIGEFAFQYARMRTLNFEENSNLKTVEQYGFCSIEISNDFTLPKSVETIDLKSFQGANFTSFFVETPSALTSIGNYAFTNSKIKYIFIPNSVNTLPEPKNYSDEISLFKGSEYLEKIEFEDNSHITELKYYHFEGLTRLKEIDFGQNSNLVSIECLFKDTKLVNLDLSGCTKLVNIDSECFANCKSLETVNLQNTKLNKIQYASFKECTNLTKVILSDSINSIGNHAFYNCSNLSEINLENVRAIGVDAFYGCNLLDPDYITREEKLTDDGIFYYTIANDEITITGWNIDETFTELVFPDEIDGLPVTVISPPNSQAENTSVQKIQLPNNLRELNHHLSYDFSNPEINVPETLEYIKWGAFYGLKIPKNLYLPNIVFIGDAAFANTGVESVYFGDKLELIEESAFDNCVIKELTFPDSMTSFNQYSFKMSAIEILNFGKNIQSICSVRDLKYNFTNLKAINIDPENPYLYSDNGILYSGDKKTLIYCPNQHPVEEYTILPETEIIGKYAFSEHSTLKEINFNDKLITIEYNAFEETSISNIEFPKTLINLGSDVFYCCSNLTSVKFADGTQLDSLSSGLFSGCGSLSNVDFGEDTVIKVFKSGSFAGCPIENFEFPNGIEILEDVSLTRIQNETIVIPETVIRIDNGVFSGCPAQRVVLNDNITFINSELFKGCTNLRLINLENITGIDKSAFANCTSLTIVDLTNVKFVDKTAFDGCINLKKFYFTNEDIESAQITDNEFQGNETIETVVIGNTVTQVGEYAFADCTSLETAFIGPAVEKISDTAFDNCDNLSIVCAPDTYAVEYAEKNNIPYSTFVVAPIPDQTYTGFEITPELKVSVENEMLVLDTDYNAYYTDNIQVGVAKVNVIGLGDYSIFASLVKFNIVAPVVEENPTETPTKPETENNKNEDNKNDTNNNDDKAPSNNENKTENKTVVKPSNNGNSKPSNNSSTTTDKTPSENKKAESNSTEDVTGSTSELDATNEPTDEPQEKLSLWKKIINAIINFFKWLFSFFG